ncbi:MAG: tail fiber domain-containing protein [Candidatus Saccharimonas sp.]|nr:tail fiber domain-containing protein [Planctomycetaceae bacterium]
MFAAFSLAWAGVASATDIVSPATVTGVNDAALVFKQSNGGQEWHFKFFPGPPSTLVMSAGPEVDTLHGTIKLRSGAPDNSLVMDTEGRISMGGQLVNPDPNAQLSISSNRLYGLISRRSLGDLNEQAHFLRLEGGTGVFRCGVQGNGHSQFGALTADHGLNLLAGGTSKMTINASGQLSFGSPPPVVPATDALMSSTGGHLTMAGVWTDNSSRVTKQEIEPLTSEQARDTVRALQPMTYRYKVQPEEPYVGFIAEDVPELVATSDRKSLAPMDFVAVLTKVVQDQDRELAEERQRNEKERQRNDKLERLVDSLMQRVADLEQRGDGTAPAK